MTPPRNINKIFTPPPPNFPFSSKTKTKNNEIQIILNPKNGTSLRIYENIRVPPPPPPSLSATLGIGLYKQLCLENGLIPVIYDRVFP